MVETIVRWYLQGNHIIPNHVNGGAKWMSPIYSMAYLVPEVGS